MDRSPDQTHRLLKPAFNAAVADSDSEETATAEHDEMIAVNFDDAAFIDAGVLSVSY